MWFLGGVAGLLIGLLIGPAWVAVALMVAGAFVPKFLRSKKNRASSTLPVEGEANGELNGKSMGEAAYFDKASVASPPVDLTRRIAALEARVHALEKQLAQTSTVPAAATVAVSSSAEISVPVQAQPERPAEPASEPVRPTLDPFESERAGPDTVPTELPAEPDTRSPLPEELPVADPIPARPSSARPKPKAPAVPWRDRLPAPLVALLFGGNSLVRVGVVVLFIGLAFLLRYTAERVSVPVEFRYAAVALIGVVLLTLGWRLRHKRTDYAQILQGAGVAVFYLTVLAAMKLHPLIPPEIGFAFLALVSLLAAVLAVLQNAYPLAIAAALGGFAAPVLASSGGGHPAPLLLYLAVLDLGIFFIAWFKAWRWLNALGFTGTFTLASAWAKAYYAPQYDTQLHAFLIFFLLLFTTIAVLFARRSLLEAQEADEDESMYSRAASAVRKVGRVDSALVFGVPMAAFGMEYGLTRQYSTGPAYVAMAMAAFYLILARWIFSRGQRGLALLAEAYAVVSVIFITLSIPLALEGVWTGAAWAVEAAGMYWLGVRQQRPHARAFAYLVIVGAAWKLLQDIQISMDPLMPLLKGSAIGPLILAASSFVMYALYRRDRRARESQAADTGKPSLLARFDLRAGTCLPWIAWFALILLPWQMTAPKTAAALTAVLSVVAFLVATGLSIRAFQAVVLGMQAVAVGSFLLTIHRAANVDVTRPIIDGSSGAAIGAVVIAASIIFTAGWRMAAMRRRSIANDDFPSWSVSSSIAVVVGVSMLHLAMMFGLSMQDITRIWPITALVVMWVALRMAHSPLAALSIALQVFSALVLMVLNQWTEVAAPLSVGVAGIATAWLVMRESRRVEAGATWVCDWTASWVYEWTPLAWGVAWWLLAWTNKASDVAAASASLGEPWAANLHVVVAIVTFSLLALLASWLKWQKASVASTWFLPVTALFALEALTYPSEVFVPSHHAGFIIWPIAFVCHLLLLKTQSINLPQFAKKLLPVAGFWFFVLLAARECQWQLGQDGGVAQSIATSWSMLGWVLAPVVALVLVRSRWVSSRWPVAEMPSVYRIVACIPVAGYLVLWLWISNVLSAGDARPLPYIPLLNPLEIGHWLVMFAVSLWAIDISNEERFEIPRVTVMAAIAVTALALLTGMVLRSVHHFFDVPWNIDAMMHSRVAQAALSVTWALAAVGTMVASNKSLSRGTWMAGSALMAVVVLKLFVVDLADRGGLYRIVSFICVGGLLLLVGYFAPVPPKVASVVEEAPPEGAADEGLVKT